MAWIGGVVVMLSAQAKSFTSSSQNLRWLAFESRLLGSVFLDLWLLRYPGSKQSLGCLQYQRPRYENWRAGAKNTQEDAMEGTLRASSKQNEMGDWKLGVVGDGFCVAG